MNNLRTLAIGTLLILAPLSLHSAHASGHPHKKTRHPPTHDSAQSARQTKVPSHLTKTMNREPTANLTPLSQLPGVSLAKQTMAKITEGLVGKTMTNSKRPHLIFRGNPHLFQREFAMHYADFLNKQGISRNIDSQEW